MQKSNDISAHHTTDFLNFHHMAVVVVSGENFSILNEAISLEDSKTFKYTYQTKKVVYADFLIKLNCWIILLCPDIQS